MIACIQGGGGGGQDACCGAGEGIPARRQQRGAGERGAAAGRTVAARTGAFIRMSEMEGRAFDAPDSRGKIPGCIYIYRERGRERGRGRGREREIGRGRGREKSARIPVILYVCMYVCR